MMIKDFLIGWEAFCLHPVFCVNTSDLQHVSDHAISQIEFYLQVCFIDGMFPSVVDALLVSDDLKVGGVVVQIISLSRVHGEPNLVVSPLCQFLGQSTVLRIFSIKCKDLVIIYRLEIV